MYQLFSKLAYLIIAPENWLIVLLLLIFLAKSAVVRKRLILLTGLIVLLFGNRYLYRAAVNAWQPGPVTLTNATYEAAIVLGGAVSFDKYEQGYFNAAADRFIQACILYKTRKVKRIIISGGSNATDQPPDAPFLYRKMLELGIPAQDLVVEDRSRTTFENAVFTKAKIDSMHLNPPFVLVTSAMHIPRATKVFFRAGLAVVPFPCDYRVLKIQPVLSDYIIPSLPTFLSWNGFLKEVVGMAGYRLFNKA